MLGGNTHTTPLYTLYMSVFKKLIEKGIENKYIVAKAESHESGWNLEHFQGNVDRKELCWEIRFRLPIYTHLFVPFTMTFLQYSPNLVCNRVINTDPVFITSSMCLLK